MAYTCISLSYFYAVFISSLRLLMKSNSIFWRLFIPFVFISLLGLILAIIYIPMVLEKNIVLNAIETAENNVKQFKVLRKYYVNNVIKKVLKNSDIKGAINHKNNPAAIPLPATLIHDLSEELNDAGTNLKLYSEFPFPNRSDRVKDSFSKQAWQALSKNTKKSYTKVETIKNVVNVRVAVADTMISDACVNCHNSHPDTPKNDWKLGDLRGVLEINIPITNQLAAGESLSHRIVGGIIAGIVMITVIFFFSYQIFIQRKLTKINDALSDIAQGEGDLTQRLDNSGDDEINQIAKSFNQFMDKLQSTISGFSDALNELTRTSNEVEQEVLNASSNMQNLQLQTDQTSAAIAQMTVSIENVVNNAQNTSQTASDAEKASNEGKKIVAKASSSINNLTNEMEKASDVIQLVRNDSESIGSVLDVIKGIAEQTNLLALNAAIEAARAGEQGRGFAVVADEVRTLANRTQKSTEEIQTMIERLQQGAKNAVDVIASGKQKTAESVIETQDVSKSLNDISSLVSDISGMNTLIASAAAEQSSVSDSINQNIASIDQSSKNNLESINKIHESGVLLSDLASRLSQLTGSFKV